MASDEDIEAGSGYPSIDPRLVPSPWQSSRRNFLRAVGLLAAGMLAPHLRAQERVTDSVPGQKLLLIVVGSMRRAETFSPTGIENIPHLVSDLMPQSLFYPHARNEGVTAHFNAIS